MTSGDSISAAAPTKRDTAVIVGWSNSSVCGSATFIRLASVFTNSVAAMESNPADTRGLSGTTIVPYISRTTAETVSTMTEILCAVCY